MKKLFLPIILSCLFAVSGKAQTTYDLDFKFQISSDTLKIGDIDTLTGFISNNGPGDFSGEISLNVSVYYISDPAGEIYPPDKVSFPLSAQPFNLDIKALGKANIKIPFLITDDFWVDSNNIVIVWPSETYKDEEDDNNYSRFDVFIKKDTSLSIKNSLKLNTGINIYPNPTKNNVKISFETVRKGQITLTDINGKTIISRQLNAGSNNYELPLSNNGIPLPTGLYFIGLQTDKERVVRKLQVIK